MNGIVLVDTSYVVFAKYYSALSWYKLAINRNPDIATIFTSNVFKNKLAQLFENSIKRVLNHFQAADRFVVFARDCNRSFVWRREHFPNYKEGRSQNGNFNSEAFKHVFNEVIPVVLTKLRGCIIGVDGAEADDVIGVLAKHIQAEYPQTPVLVLSNDNDCIQLINEHTNVYNLLLQDVGSRRGTLTPKQFLQSRIVSGDRSDNIPSVVPRIGAKTAFKLVTEHDFETLRKMYNIENYDRNDLLMNLENIPIHLKDSIMKIFNSFDPSVFTSSTLTDDDLQEIDDVLDDICTSSNIVNSDELQQKMGSINVVVSDEQTLVDS